jgi:hypothetical protein
MTAFNSNALFNDLTEAETTQLNGGRRCIRVRVLQYVKIGFFWAWRYVTVIRCY